MDNLKMYSDEEIIELIKNNKVSSSDLTDSGICPTCFNKKIIMSYMAVMKTKYYMKMMI